MSWNAPKSYAEAASSIRALFSWRMQRANLRGDWVACLSVCSVRAELGRAKDHPLTDHVITGAERYADDYMHATSPVTARDPHPSVVTYYVQDLQSGRVVLALQADGTILDELSTVRPDLRPATVAMLRDAMRIAADNQRTRQAHDRKQRAKEAEELR